MCQVRRAQFSHFSKVLRRTRFATPGALWATVTPLSSGGEEGEAEEEKTSEVVIGKESWAGLEWVVGKEGGKLPE